MSTYLLTPLARTDLFAIWSYIAKDSASAADRVEEAMYQACSMLAESPALGHTRVDLTVRRVRFWTSTRYPNYTVVYRPDTAPLQIIAFLHGKRDSKRILSERR